MQGVLTVYVVYDNPSDYPVRYVLREQFVTAGGVRPAARPLAVSRMLDVVLRQLPEGVTQVQRPGTDPDPCIHSAYV